MRPKKTFYYEGHDRMGEAKVGTIEAANEETAAGLLREKGIYVQELNTEKINPKLDKNALGSPVEKDDTPEDSSEEFVDEEEEAVKERPDPTPRTNHIPAVVMDLRQKVEKVATVLRVLDTWGKLGQKEESDNIPKMGGKSWNMLFYDGSDEQSEELRKEVLKSFGVNLFKEVITDFCKED